MIPSSPEQQQRHAAKRVRFPSEDLSHVAHIDVVSREHRQEYWYTVSEDVPIQWQWANGSWNRFSHVRVLLFASLLNIVLLSVKLSRQCDDYASALLPR